MTKSRIITIIAAAIAITGIILVTQSPSKLREENQALRQQLEHRTQLAVENDRLSKSLAQRGSSPSDLDRKLNDLARLRDEVESLRRQSNELARLRTENQQLRSASATLTAAVPPVSASDRLPRESWAFAGYATPQSALQSSLWAMSRGDAQAVLASMPSQTGGKAWEGRSEAEIGALLAAKFQPLFNGVTAANIVNQQTISRDEMVLTVDLQGRNDTTDFRLRRVDGEWKFTGFGGPPRKQ